MFSLSMKGSVDVLLATLHCCDLLISGALLVYWRVVLNIVYFSFFLALFYVSYNLRT